MKIPQAGTRKTSALALAGYLAVALIVLWPLPLNPTTHMIGDAFGDPLLNAWILGWDAERMQNGLRGLWQAPLFYPAPDTLAWSEHLLGIAVLVAPAYWLTGNIVFVYNLALLGSIVLAGFGMFLLARELTGRHDAAWLAGLLFACLPYRVAEISHLQVLYAGWMPLALLGLHRYFRTGSRRALAGCVAAYVLTALSNGYYLFFLGIPVVIVAGWHLATRMFRRTGGRTTAGHLALAAFAIVVALTPVIRVYLRVRETQGFARSREEMTHFSARPAAYGSVASTVRVWHGWLPVGAPATALFPGLTLSLLAALGVYAGWRRDDVRLYGTVAVVAFVLTLGPRPDIGFGPMATGPYDWLLAVPGLDGLRVPARLAIVVYLGMAAVAAVGAAWVLASVRSRTAFAVLVLASAAAVGEGVSTNGVMRFPTTDMSSERAAYQWLRSQPAGPMLELPVGGTREATRYLTGTLVHGNRIVNGYSGHGWALQGLFGGPVVNELGQAHELLRAARAVGLRYVLVHRQLFGDRAHGAGLDRAIRGDREQVERVLDFGTTSAFVLRPLALDSRGAVFDPTLLLSRCTFAASDNVDSVGRATDGNIDSRWLSGRAQQGNEWVVVRCPDTRVLTSVELLVNRRSFSDYPRRLAIDVSADGVSFFPHWEGGVVAELAVSLARSDRPPTIRIAVAPATFRAVRLRQTSETPRRWFWSIDELQLRGR